MRRSTEQEQIDCQDTDPATLHGNLRDLVWINRWLGGVWITRLALGKLLGRDARSVSLLDVGTGAGDMPRALWLWATRRGMRPWVAACDISPMIVQIAAGDGTAGSDRAQHHLDRTAFFAADGTALPFASNSFDVSMCSLALHHMNPDAALATLRELARTARRGVVVGDIVRSRPGVWAAWLLTRAVSSNPMTRHDGPASVRRAYSKNELRALCRQAGLYDVTVFHLGYRVALAARVTC